MRPASKLSLISILRRSLLHRRARALSALVALTVSAAVATALLTLYADLDAKLHHEFRSFGANIVVTQQTGFDSDSLVKAQQAAGSDARAAAFAYAVATTDRGTNVVVAGVDFPAVQALDAWWQVDHWPDAANQALLGQRAAQFVGDEHSVALNYSGKSVTLAGVGRLKTGGDEDSRIYIPLATFTTWTNAQPTVIEIQVPGGEAKVDAALARLKQAFPQAQIAPVRQLVEGESGIVDKTHALMFGAVLLIALTVAVSVLATLSASVLERRRDFALMKALGSSDTQLMRLFALETLVLASGGILCGYIVGSFAAWGISEANFGTSALPRVQVIPLVILLNLIIAALAALIPVRQLRGLEPAALLKGE